MQLNWFKELDKYNGLKSFKILNQIIDKKKIFSFFAQIQYIVFINILKLYMGEKENF